MGIERSDEQGSVSVFLGGPVLGGLAEDRVQPSGMPRIPWEPSSGKLLFYKFWCAGDGWLAKEVVGVSLGVLLLGSVVWPLHSARSLEGMMVSEAETGSSVVPSCRLLFLWCLFLRHRAECVKTQGTWCLGFLPPINILLPHPSSPGHTHTHPRPCLHSGQYKE